jgi:AcrR family transcriptional regulator
MDQTAQASAEDRPTKQRRYSPEVRRQMILDAAAQLLRENPEANVDDVAAAAGVTRQLVGQYFPGGGIERIHAELMGRAATTFVEQVLSIDFPAPKNLEEWREVIVQTTRRQFEWAVGLKMPWLFAAEASGLPAKIGAARMAVMDNMIPPVMEWSRNVIDDTPVNRLMVKAEYRAIDGLIWLVATDQLDLEEGVRLAVARWQGVIEFAVPLLNR